MRFQDAVLATPGLEQAYRSGLQALRAVDRGRIDCPDPKGLAGSLDLDSCLKELLPSDPRWDYGIGLNRSEGHDQIVWIEVHPANSHHVDEVLRKHRWLKDWLHVHGSLLKPMSARFVWVASGPVALTANSPQRRRVAAAGVHFAGHKYVLSL